jgi:hypothetical protein
MSAHRRAIASGDGGTDPRPRRRTFATLAIGLFLLIAALRLALVVLFAPETPYFDEWDGVIDRMARRMLADSYPLAALFEPHNEHTLVWTRLLSYAQLRLADLQFDNVTVCLVSQCLYAAIAAALIAAAAQALPPFRGGFVAAAGLVAALPYGWENIAVGWGNPYYFMIGFSAATLLLAARLRGPLSTVPLALAALAAGVSMGSGVAAGVVALLVVFLRWRCGELPARAAQHMAIPLLLATGLLLANASPSAAPTLHWGPLQSAELALALVLWLPVWLLGARLLRGRGNGVDAVFVGFAVWGFLQLLAILVGRPQFRLWFPISRYIDVLAVGAFANLGCLCRFAMANPEQRAWTRLARGGLVAAVVASLAFLPFAWHWTRVRAADERAQVVRLERYIRHGDSAAIAEADGNHLAHPSRERLRELVDAPDVQRILGDRVGTRPEPSAWVREQRALRAALLRHGGWLLPLILALGLLVLARVWRPATVADG